MDPALGFLIFPRQRLRRVQAEVGDLSDAVTRLYDMDLSQVRWAACREGVLARISGGAFPELLVRIPSAKLECAALMVYLRAEGGWGCRLCWKGTVEDAFLAGARDDPSDPVTPEQHAARLARRFPGLDREGVLACLELPAEVGPDILERFLGVLAPWACELAGSDQLEPAAPPPQSPRPDAAPPLQNAPDAAGQSGPEPGPEACLPWLTSVRALRRPWSFPLSLLYLLFPKKRPAPEDIPHQGWTARELEYMLDRFCGGDLAHLELNFTLPGEGTYVRRLNKTVYQPFQLTLELIREGDRSMCLLLDGQDHSIYRVIADRKPYMEVDIKQLEHTTFCGQTVKRYVVFQGKDLETLRRETTLLLSRLDCRDAVFSPTARMGAWSRLDGKFDQGAFQAVSAPWRLG